ncbi:putative zinc-binding protein [Eubacteriaceae bacterium ES3]|nr:putative zinc-binding protein [Eubacteriaceae bacterium ES3]
MSEKKIGVVACSGEECLGGTISRLAVRKIMEEDRPGTTTTLCLPLFIAGDGGEREFAKNYPTIAVDGCSKCCAKRSIEKFSSQVAGSVDIEKIFGIEKALAKPLSTRNVTKAHREMVDEVSIEILKIYDEL